MLLYLVYAKQLPAPGRGPILIIIIIIIIMMMTTTLIIQNPQSGSSPVH